MAIRNIVVQKQFISTIAPLFLKIKSQSSSINRAHNPADFASVFQRYGFSLPQLPDFLGKNEFLLSSSPSETENSFKILLSLNPAHDFLVSVVSSCPRVLEPQFLEEWRESSFQFRNFTPIAMKNVLEVSRRFELSPDYVLKRIRCLKDMGFSQGTITRILETEPVVILTNKDAITDQIDFLLGIGIQTREIDGIVGLFPGIVAFGVETRLKELVKEFKDQGFTRSQVKNEVLRNPEVLGFENGEISQCLEMLRSLKCRIAIKDSIFKTGEFRAAYEVKLRVNCLTKHGLTCRDAFAVLWKEPRVILYEIKEVEEKIKFLVQKMRFDIQCIVEVPEYLGLNFDKQIAPRFKVIENLRLSGGLGDQVTLRNFVKLSRLRFYNLYVKPYPELEKMYGRFAGEGQVRGHHPVGMWKLFRPQQNLRPVEDDKNIGFNLESEV